MAPRKILWSKVFEVRIRTRNRLNGSHEHWTTIARERKRERAATALAWYVAVGAQVRPTLPVHVSLLRVSPGTTPMDEPDGLSSALKTVRDQIAKHLGVDDADPRVSWAYAQERGDEHLVRVTLETWK